MKIFPSCFILKREKKRRRFGAIKALEKRSLYDGVEVRDKNRFWFCFPFGFSALFWRGVGSFLLVDLEKLF
ncbi:MAG: hypothetical protein D6805_04895 [Planctomycetota bacterium]|nr:MAG: hypothetical protein D6805_04895 [Planctomycetota bacterium]